MNDCTPTYNRALTTALTFSPRFCVERVGFVSNVHPRIVALLTRYGDLLPVLQNIERIPRPYNHLVDTVQRVGMLYCQRTGEGARVNVAWVVDVVRRSSASSIVSVKLLRFVAKVDEQAGVGTVACQCNGHRFRLGQRFGHLHGEVENSRYDLDVLYGGRLR